VPQPACELALPRAHPSIRPAPARFAIPSFTLKVFSKVFSHFSYHQKLMDENHL
jgi:hypothetical protein